MCCHAEFDRSALKGVGINTGEPPKMGALELRYLGMGNVVDHKIYAPPHTCYHVKFGTSVTKGVRINRREPPKLGSAGAPRGVPALPNFIFGVPFYLCVRQNWGALGSRPLGVRAWLTPKNNPSPCVSPRQIWQFCDKGVRTNRKEPLELGSAGASTPWSGGVTNYSNFVPKTHRFQTFDL